jgi:uncharacterized protein (DUF697 family)/predicted GTPase
MSGMMAVDKTKTKELIDGVNAAFDVAASGLPAKTREWVKKNVIGAAIGEIEKLVVESRPPVLYVMGRSGHGKSSLINALAGRKVAEVGHIKPSTVGADPYFISFPEFYAEWEIIDSRGIFETTTPEGAPKKNALAQVKEDIKKYRPDAILHVIAAPETRTLENDFKAFAEVQKVVAQEMGTPAPSIMVVSKVDVIGNPRDWPIEEHPNKAGLVKKLLDYVTDDVLECPREKLDLNSSIKGYSLIGGDYAAIVPVCTRESDEWNVDTLSSVIGKHLPESALLDYYQAQQRKELLRRLSTSVIRRFSAIGAGIGSAPVPIADIAVLTPLQLLLVALIAGLSCRPFSLDSVSEFTAATGVNVVVALGARQLARQLVKFVPVAGLPTSGAIAGAATFGIGKSAESYFFYGEVKRPATFVREWLLKRNGEKK